ncbi:winged helix-turn-helix domain-containing protein [Photobacterium satsumensis]|uniref:winged helix-turn-helix domain-containing protein n=1 Tax=Photobacterium satsumensis TaxID=2910239 RepID=UPI003D0F4978
MCDLNDSSGKRLFLNDEVYLIEERRSITNSRSGNEAVFSTSEVSIIKELVMAGGKPVSRRYLLDNCWGGRVVTNTSLSVAINKIRERLTSVGLKDAILTVPRCGYQINLTDDEKLEVVPLFNQSQEADKEEQVNQNQEVDNEKQACSTELVEDLINDDQAHLSYINFKLNGLNINSDYLIVSMSWVISSIIFAFFFFNI